VDNEMSSVIFVFSHSFFIPGNLLLRFYDANLKDYSNISFSRRATTAAVMRVATKKEGNAANSLFLFFSHQCWIIFSVQNFPRQRDTLRHHVHLSLFFITSTHNEDLKIQ
jgi:hypothetical protein